MVFFREDDGSVPILEWYDTLQKREQAKCMQRLEELEELGHELRRPLADHLRDGIHELRATAGTVQNRILYFFNGQSCAVLSHGIAKEGKVPAIEIDRALAQKAKFVNDPDLHSAEAEF